MPLDAKETKTVIADQSYWTDVASIIECNLIGFTYRDRALMVHQENRHRTITMPGWLAEIIIRLSDGQEGG